MGAMSQWIFLPVPQRQELQRTRRAAESVEQKSESLILVGEVGFEPARDFI